MLLSPKKIADVRARLTTTDFDPVRLENDQVFVFYDLALDVIAFRRADLKNVVQNEKKLTDRFRTPAIETRRQSMIPRNERRAKKTEGTDFADYQQEYRPR